MRRDGVVQSYWVGRKPNRKNYGSKPNPVAANMLSKLSTLKKEEALEFFDELSPKDQKAILTESNRQMVEEDLLQDALEDQREDRIEDLRSDLREEIRDEIREEVRAEFEQKRLDKELDEDLNFGNFPAINAPNR